MEHGRLVHKPFWVKNTGNYWVTVPDVHCIISDTIHITTTPIPSLTNSPLSKSICSGESTNIPLTANVPGATFHWTATLTSGNITGFSPDSGLIINQVLVNTLATPGIVTYHITPKVGSCSGTTVDFPVTINPGDSVKSVFLLQQTTFVQEHPSPLWQFLRMAGPRLLIFGKLTGSVLDRIILCSVILPIMEML